MAIPAYPLIILAGQSNCQGSSPSPSGPEGGVDFAATTLTPDASVRFFASDNFGEHTSVASMGMVSWGSTINNASLAPHFGPEQQCAATLKANGWTNMTFLKWTHNGQPITNFIPGGVDHFRLHRVLTLGRPRQVFTPFFYYHQGETDALAGGSQAQADAWGANFTLIYNAVTAAVGKTLVGGKLIGRINVNIYNTVDGDNSSGQTVTAPWVANVRTQQANSADHLIDTDSFPRYSQDHLHFTGAGQHAHGLALANLLLSLV